jgi:SnoaL-like polyketide cyclase
VRARGETAQLFTVSLPGKSAGGDRVVSHCTMRGTHSGVWMGIAATGKKVSVPVITIHRILGAKIVEDWVLVGSLSLFQQLGLVPLTHAIVARAS